MDRPSILYNVAFLSGPGVRARAWLNDLPIYTVRPTATNDGTTMLANHLLWPGENTLRIEVQQMGKPETSFFHVDFLREDDPEIPAQRFHSAPWPQLWDSWPEELRVLPFNHVSTFSIPDDHPQPIVASAKPEDVPIDGTPEMHAAVFELHQALAKKDGVGIVDAVALRMEDQKRFYGDISGTKKSAYVPGYAEAFRDPWEVPPFDAKRLVFERCAGGRAVFVTGLDGEHAVHGKNMVNPEQSYETDLLLVRHEGRWRAFR